MQTHIISYTWDEVKARSVLLFKGMSPCLKTFV